MELSGEWKSLWCIGSAFPAPLLLTGSEAASLGPLIFSQDGSPRYLHNCTISDFPENIFSQYYVPHRLAMQCLRDDIKLQQLSNPGNCLESLKLQDDTLGLFFPAGKDLDQIGFLTLKKGDFKMKSYSISSNLHSPILELSSVALYDDGWEKSSRSGTGLLAARTLYGVHWFKVRKNRTSLRHLGHASFEKEVFHACFSPHIPEESSVVLDSGEVRLFDLESLIASKKPLKLSGKVLPFEAGIAPEREEIKGVKFFRGVSEVDISHPSDFQGSKWWSCEFGWHPRTVLVAGKHEVRLVDFRTRKDQRSDYVSVLAQARMPGGVSYCGMSPRNDVFCAFTRADYDYFKFAIASRQHLFLYDSRMPLTPVLQWEHNMLDKPNHLKICELSELRAGGTGKCKWASDFGKVLFAASFKSGECKAFCYGPRLQGEANIHSTMHIFPHSDSSEIPTPMYAWDLPLKVVTGNENARVGQRKKLWTTEFVSDEDSYIDELGTQMPGVCIFPNKLSALAASHSLDACDENGNSFSGFSLVQLTEKFDILFQDYKASKCHLSRKTNIGFICSDCELPLDSITKFRRKGMKDGKESLQFFHCYLKSGSIFDSSLQSLFMPSEQPVRNDAFEQAYSVILSNKKGLSSVSEMSFKWLWKKLPKKATVLGFLKDLKYHRSGKLNFSKFLQIPSLNPIENPPIYFDVIQEKFEDSVFKDQSLWGPVLPLPFLLQISSIKEGKAAFSAEDEVGYYAQVLLDALDNSQKAGIKPAVCPYAVSLSSDDTAVFDEKDEIEKNDLFVQRPLWNFYNACDDLCENLNGRNENIETKRSLPSRLYNEFVEIQSNGSSLQNASFLTQLVDGICPINLSFEESDDDFKADELKGLKDIKQKFSSWEQSSERYQGYLSSSVSSVSNISK